jgi:glycosyltransferase involved in cell wall biosynthesis
VNILIAAGSRGALSQLRPEFESFITMAERGHRLTVIIQPDSVYVPRLRELGIRMLHCYPETKIDLKSIRALRAELRHTHYDIIYATTSKTIPNAAFAAIGFPAKLVVYRGTTGGLHRHDPTAYLTILHPRVDGVVCVSEAVRKDVLRQVWKNRDQVVTIHKGHDLEWSSRPPADLGEFGITTQDFVVICAVNARPSKGIDIMLDAANQLAHIPDLHLLLVGKGMDEEPYTTLIAGNRMRERIHVAGFRQNAPELIAASDLLVQPSRSGEGLPRAVMEAMGYGTPVIITDTGGGKEVVEDGISGFVIPVEDPAAISNRIEQLYGDRELCRQMATNGRKNLEDRFSSTRTTDRYLEYFGALAGRPQATDLR